MLERSREVTLFDRASLAVAENSDGMAVFATDFQPGPSGYVRVLVLDRGMTRRHVDELRLAAGRPVRTSETRIGQPDRRSTRHQDDEQDHDEDGENHDVRNSRGRPAAGSCRFPRVSAPSQA